MDAATNLRNEIRRDYRTGRYVIVAPDRGKRPEDFVQAEKEPETGGKCPFDPGNELMTKEIMRVGKPWKIRVVENKYPEFSPDIPLDQGGGKLEYISGYGYNEVLVDTPIHNLSFDRLDEQSMRLWLDTLIEREADLYTRNYIKYVQIFKNSGLGSGESLMHPHTQIMAWPEIIGSIKEEIERTKEYKEQYGKCLYEDIMEEESARTIIETERIFAVAPYASRFVGESMMMTKRHVGFLQDLATEEKDEMVGALKTTLKMNRKLFGNVSYNICFYEIKSEPDFHAHIDIYPRLNIPAGVEFGEDVFVNQLPPERYADAFKQKLEDTT